MGEFVVTKCPGCSDDVVVTAEDYLAKPLGTHRCGRCDFEEQTQPIAPTVKRCSICGDAMVYCMRVGGCR